MRFQHVRIESLGYVVPPEPISSAEIEARLAPVYQRLKLPEGRLELMTGIETRHFWPQPIRPSEASAQAGEHALAQSRFDREQIDLLVHCGVCRDRLEPATAAYVHGLLGLSSGTQIFDLSNACLGFVNAMTMAASMIQAGSIRRALLVSGENGRPLLERTIQTLLERPLSRREIKPYFANLTIGAGAVAMVLCHEDEAPTDAPELLGGVVETDSSANELCQGDTAGDALEMLTEAEQLLEAGLKVAERTWHRFQDLFGWSHDEVDHVICHQVGRTHQRRLLETLQMPVEKDYPTYPYMGNVGSVSLPFSLAKAIENGVLTTGQRVALLGIGSGLSSAMLGLKIH
ncbi:MAG: 3-oxoacyl-acyl-carrier-protein synthase III [Puniceicoccaceae bacterium 5H]|nr:MAG: 3-oxoacyl-acyl-carrier-protein synthase III [Puniceicoccaceae bacterium 5H]